jgi:peptidoglycan/LPS O-acetylase OafA/YrhL
MVASIASPICLGALLACALHARRGFAIAARGLGRAASAPVLLVALAALVAWDGAPLVAIHGVMALLVGACCVRGDHGARVLLDAPPVRFLGMISYGLYMIHVSAITAAKWVLPAALSGALPVFLLGLALAIPTAYLSYRFVERPLLALRKRLHPLPR